MRFTSLMCKRATADVLRLQLSLTSQEVRPTSISKETYVPLTQMTTSINTFSSLIIYIISFALCVMLSICGFQTAAEREQDVTCLESVQLDIRHLETNRLTD